MAGTKAKKAAEEATADDPRFTREQLLSAKNFADRRDILSAVLSSEKQYSLKEAEAAIEKYMKGKVK